MTIYDGGFPDQPESEREQQHGPWDQDGDETAELDSDDNAPWRGPDDAPVHPPLEDVPGRPFGGYPGKDDRLENEGDGHGNPGS